MWCCFMKVHAAENQLAWMVWLNGYLASESESLYGKAYAPV